MHRRALPCQATLSGQGLGTILPSSNHARIRHRSSSAASAKRRPPPRLPKHQYNEAKQVTMKIIDRAARQPNDWKHTHTLRGEEKRLGATIQLDASSTRGMSMEKAANTIITHGIVLGQVSLDRRRRLVILTTHGEVWQPIREDVAFTIPDFVPTDLVSRCGLLAYATDQTQINARIEVLKRLRDLDRNIERAYNFVCQKSTEVYYKVRSPDPHKWAETTVAEVAHMITPKSDTLTLFATHKYMMSNALYFIAQDSYESIQTLRVRPKSHVDNIRTIQDWSRRNDGPIQSFAVKARKIIAASQEIQKVSQGEAPTVAPASHVWTETDREILTFLQNSLRRTRTMQLDPYSLGQCFILKQLSLDRPRIDDSEVHKALIDLGVLAPWLDLVSLEPDLDLNTEPESTSSQIKVKEAITAKGFASIASSTHETPLGPEDFYPTDPLDSVRHDFGDLPVFIIDEGSAEELDDGVSIERIPSEPDNFWAHVHIADLASIMPPTHVFAKEASVRSESAYFIHRSWPLFPRNLMKNPQYGLSLGAREAGQPTPVLTFSSKINGQGEMTDFKVRAGLIRNTQVVTYNEVDAALGFKEIPYWYPFGRILQSKPTFRTLSESHISDLRDLRTIANRVIAKRQRENVVLFSRPVPEIKSVMRPPEIYGPVFEPTIFRGFPTFEYSVADASDLDTGSHGMVSEMMKLASRAASRFCTERGVPMIRRSADPRMMVINGNPQELFDLRTPNNYVRHDLGLVRVESGPAGEYTLESKAHYGLGVPDGEGYCRTTSPLRRYIDLVSHWQLHHALLGSAAPTTGPPFDTNQLMKMAVSAHATEKLHQGLKRRHLRYWQLMILQRWADGTASGLERHDDPLQMLKGVTLSTPTQNESTGKFHVEASIRLLGLSASLEGLDSSDIPPGTTLPVKVQECRLGVRPQLLVTLK
ncbi:hypothetical protein D9615_004421 [Tricholomella constricta]|uniref:RNB domain-containing protein n=1 Tax=Tricholomella constricta TaxID=117010 RepID=A0A8H5M5M6_9AGAR|nr:hypothetical protein D9615_004421 [Tricholomella constricta]